MVRIVRRLPALVLILTIALALALRLWRIDATPPGFHLDESFEGFEAWRILTDATYRPIFLTGNFGVPPLNAYANVLMFWLFQAFGAAPGPTAMRVTAASFGVLGVLAVYAAARELQFLDRRLSSAFPLFAAASLAVMRWHLHFSRMGIEPIITPLLWAAAVWLQLRGWRRGHWADFAGCGVLLAACIYTYQGAWVIPLVIAALTVLLVGRTLFGGAANEPRPNLERALGFRSRMLGPGIAAFTATLLVAPLLWFFWRNPELLLLRPSQIVIVGATNSPADDTLWHTAWATLRMYWPLDATGDLDPRRNLPGAPVLSLWQALPFFAGLLLSLWHWRRPASAILVLSLAGLLSVGVLSEYAPHFHRILAASAPTALLCAVGLDWLWQRRPAPAPFVRWATLALLTATLVTTARDYFVRWAALPDLYYAFDAGLWDVGRWIARQPADAAIYLTPRSTDHPTLAFALATAPQPHAWPVTFDGRTTFPLAAQPVDHPEVYLAIEPEDFRTRLLLHDIFPDAAVITTFTDAAGQVYANAYERPPGMAAQRPPLTERQVAVGDGLSLLGYDVQPASLRSGQILYLQLHWLVATTPGADWTVFAHLVDPTRSAGAPQTGFDSPLGGGNLPTTRWRPGWRVLDELQIALPAGLPPGDYRLEVGLYQSTGARLPADGAPIVLGTVTVQ